MKHLIYIFAFCVLTFSIIGNANAQVPNKISYQGLLTTSAGTPVQDGSYNLTFNIFDVSTGGSALWTEDQTGVAVQRGTFNVLLGSVTTLDISFNQTLYVEVTATPGPGIPSPITFSPRSELTNSPYSFSIIGTQCEATGPYSSVGGRNNRARGAYSVVSGGGGATEADSNSALADYSTVSGGQSNKASDRYTTVSGGAHNTASGQTSTVAGGWSNVASGREATVSGGINNTSSQSLSTIGGGEMNTASRTAATVGGGSSNQASGDRATVGGGAYNYASGDYSTVGGGWSSRARGAYSFVGGGGGSTLADSNSALGENSTIGGGSSNIASAFAATIGGGWDNTASGPTATIGGGKMNTASGGIATIAGGWSNTASGWHTAVGGGGFNSARGIYSVVCGGGGLNPVDSNSALGDASTIGGGSANKANGSNATIGGGAYNTTSANYTTIGGGYNNTASNHFATVVGGRDNTASGQYSFASGRRAKANHDGAFVWADQTDADFASTAINQFNIRAVGGTRIFSNTALSAGVTLAAGASSWASVSDSTLKRNKRLVDSKVILEKVARLPVMQWSYLSQNPNIEHIGPMAQDFYAIFGLGDDEKTISTIDPAGVALAAIQGLIQENKELQTKNEELSNRLTELEAVVKSMAEEMKVINDKSLGELR
ncbi:MAG: tail fiber domain-containing protein [Bacteroidota bacterium]|nr:tail fiber domain-containing protein [Bacteroidota bacterium]